MKAKNMKYAKDEEKIEKDARKYSARVTPDYVSAAFDDKRVLHGDWVNKSRDRKAKEEFMKDFGGKKPKNAKLHERVNKRGEKFKSQHESIAILLTEAALLLND
jgi:hypothetical protein